MCSNQAFHSDLTLTPNCLIYTPNQDKPLQIIQNRHVKSPGSEQFQVWTTLHHCGFKKGVMIKVRHRSPWWGVLALWVMMECERRSQGMLTTVISTICRYINLSTWLEERRITVCFEWQECKVWNPNWRSDAGYRQRWGEGKKGQTVREMERNQRLEW